MLVVLTDKEFLLLCELANTITSAEIHNSIMKSADWMEEIRNSSIKDRIAHEIFASPRLTDLHIGQYLKQDNICLLMFVDDSGNSYGVVISKECEISDIHKQTELDEAIRTIEYTRGSGNCILTGYKLGGLSAAGLAAKLQVEAIVFGAPSIEILSGKVKNFIAENDPVGGYIEKVIFVKQDSTWADNEGSYFETLEFDEWGQALVTKQSDYSKFVTWFYHTASTIDRDIWKIFFKDTEEDQLMMEKGLYSIYPRVDELNNVGIHCSIDKVINYIENELKTNRSIMRAELKKIEIADLELQIGKIADKLATQAIDLIHNTYRSVETILMGMGLFTMDNTESQIGTLMEKFNIDMNLLFDKELGILTDSLENELQNCLDELLKFPDLAIDW
jgi:hypothetical protein